MHAFTYSGMQCYWIYNLGQVDIICSIGLIIIALPIIFLHFTREIQRDNMWKIFFTQYFQYFELYLKCICYFKVMELWKWATRPLPTWPVHMSPAYWCACHSSSHYSTLSLTLISGEAPQTILLQAFANTPHAKHSSPPPTLTLRNQFFTLKKQIFLFHLMG